MKVRIAHLKFFERATLRQIVRARPGLTVAEARRHCCPEGMTLVVHTIGATLLALFAGLIFLPFMLIAVTAPIGVPLLTRASRKRWLFVLPPERDGELVELE